MRALFTSIRNVSHFFPLVPFIEACRQHGHEVGVAAPADLAERVARMSREPALSLFPAKFEAPARELAVVSRFRAARKEASALPAWWSTRQEPLVYVTLGTVTGGLEPMRAAYRRVLDAVSNMPIRVLLTTGAELPHEALGELPANVHVERFVPQDDVFPHAAAVLCHGGAGTVIGALAAGVPMVVTPLFADQPQNAERVQAVGVGLGLPTGAAAVDDIRSSLTRVLEELAFRSAARGFAQEIAALPPVSDAAIELERLAR